MDCILAHHKLRPRARLVQQGSRFKRRLARPNNSNVPPLEGGEALNPGSMGRKSWRQGCNFAWNVGKACQARRKPHTVCDKILPVGKCYRKAVSLSCHVRHVNWLDPRHIRLLEPIPICSEVADRARLKRFQTARPAIVREGKPGLRRRDIRSEAISPQVAVAPCIGDLRPEQHRTTKDTMFYIPRSEMRSKRKTIGPRTDDCDGDPAHDGSFASVCGVKGDGGDAERINRGSALRPRQISESAWITPGTGSLSSATKSTVWAACFLIQARHYP